MKKPLVDQQLNIQAILKYADLPWYDLRMRRTKSGYYSYIWRANSLSHWQVLGFYLERANKKNIKRKFNNVKKIKLTPDGNLILQVLF